MEHREHFTKLPSGEETASAKATKAKTGAAADYFERYEKGRKEQEGRKGAEESNMEYWLSGDEEESHQLKRRKGKTQRDKEPYVVQEAKSLKLRPAEDVLKRLRWDPCFNVADCTIGYLERFEVVKEMPMTIWISDISEEGFIPQHRIKYFKRNNDGEIVWDREGGLVDKGENQPRHHTVVQRQRDES